MALLPKLPNDVKDENQLLEYLRGLSIAIEDIAKKFDGYNAGNTNGNVPVSNGTVNSNLNADMVDSYHASPTPTASTIPVADSSGKLNSGWMDFSCLKGTNGYTKLPNGVIIQWGYGYTSGHPTGTYFPIAFPTYTAVVMATNAHDSGYNSIPTVISPITLTYFTVAARNADNNIEATTFFYIAIGW